MNKPISSTLEDYIKSQSRNKIIFHTQYFYDFDSVNIGTRISEGIYDLQDPSRLPMRVLSVINNTLNASIYHHDVFGRYLSIENLGILFEPELKIDFASLLDNFSQNNLLMVKWDGEIDTENIYFLSKDTGIKMNIKNLSYIAI
jgi:hypothetical protein